MSDIRRYECDGYAGDVWMEEKVLGDYVKYEEHLAIVEKLKVENERLKTGLNLVGQHARQMFVDGWYYGYDSITDEVSKPNLDTERFLASIEDLKALLRK